MTRKWDESEMLLLFSEASQHYTFFKDLKLFLSSHHPGNFIMLHRVNPVSDLSGQELGMPLSSGHWQA